MRQIHGYFLGHADYENVHALQHTLFEARKAGNIGDTILFVEHPTVITAGRGAKPENLLRSPDELAAAEVAFSATGRGGDVTLHAPGQLVCYPILDLSPDRRDVRKYVKDLTSVMQRLVATWSIAASPWDKYIGLWVDSASPAVWSAAGPLSPAKIGAIGVRLSHWVTMHGFALNLTTDLSLFRYIVPCGISEYPVTSVQALTGHAPSVEYAAALALQIFAEIFQAHTGDLENRDVKSFGFSDPHDAIPAL